MKSYTKILIVAELVDTSVSFAMIRTFGFREMNPMGFTLESLSLKALATIIAALFLELYKNPLPAIVWMIPTVPVLTCLWNGIVVLAFMLKY